MINFTSLISKVSKVSKVSQQNCESRMGTCQADAQHLPMTYLPVDSVSIVSRQSVLAKYAAMVTLLLTLACGNVWGTSVVALTAGEYDMTSAAATAGSKIFGMKNNIYYGRNGGGLAAGCEVKSGSMIAFKIAQASTVKFYVRNSKAKSITDTWDIKSISNADFSAIVAQYDAGGTAATYYSNANSSLGTITITQGTKSDASTSGYTSVSVELSAGAYGFYLSTHSADGEFVDKVKITAAGCSGYSFHYGPHTGDWETPICFEQVGSTHEWKITDFTIPSHTNGEFYVGYAGSTNSQSVTRAWTYGYSDGNGAMKLLPTSNSIVGQATGAKGTISIWDDSGWQNQNVGFTPNGYGVTYGGVGHAFNTTATENMWETDVVTLPDVSTTYTMGLATATTGTYVTCAHSSAAEAISNMGVTILEGGKKKILLAPGSFNTAGAVYAVWDGTNSAWGDGTTKLFTDADGDGVWECPVASNCTSINLVRLSSGTTASNIDWSRKWNQTANISVGDLLNKYTITSLSGDNCAYTTTAMHPATGQKGKFRMWANSGDNNWFVHWIPYYVLTYNANGGSGAPSAQSVSSEASPCQLTVSSTEPTRTDYIFEGWSTSSSAVSPDGAWGPGDTHAMTGDVTLYAVWTHCSGPSITAFSNSEGHNYNQGDVATTMTVTAAAGNGGTLHYHWYQYNVGQNPETQSIDAVGGTDANTYTPSTASAHEGQIFYCVVSEEGCSTTVKSAYSGAITVLAPPCEISDCGNASITYAIKVGSSGSQETDGSDFITSATPSNSTALGASTTIGLSTMTISDGNMKAAAATNDCFGSKPNMTGKLGVYNGSAYSSSYYLQFTFTVKGGYTFTPCDIQFIVQPVSNTADFCWEITDGTNIYGYGTRAGVLKGSDGGATVLTGLTSTSAMSTGTYYIRLYPNYNGSGNTFRMGTDVILKGTTAASVCTTSPTVTAGSNSSVTATTATVSCASGISSLGSAGCSISSYGFVISESANPEIGGIGVTQHEVGTSYASTGTSFSKNLTGLTASTTYYVRPYATNGNGTAYGTQTSFTTSVAPTLTSLVSGIRYDVADMVPAGTTISGSEQTPTGLSENTKFYLVGPTAMSVKNDSKTVDGINFANSYYFKAAATLSSNTPTDRAIKFILPCAGTVTAWLRQSAKVSLAKEGIAGTAFGSGNSEAYDKYSLDVASGGTYYIYATGSTTTLYAIKFDALVCDPLTVNRGGTSDGVYIVGQDGGVLTCSATTGTIATYQWKQYTSGQGIGDTINAIGSGATTASFTPHPTSAGIYYYLCRANDACGNVAVTSTTGTFVFNAACTSVAAPTGLTCSAQTGTSLTFTWTNAANASGYTATLYSDSGCESEVTHQDLGDVATVTFSTLSSATTYYCKVQSHGDGSTYCAAGGTTAAQSGTTKTLYTITYAKGSAGGASGDNFTDTKTHGVNLTLSSNSSAFTRSGYTYDGWSTNTDGSTKDYNLGGTYTANSAITLYPHWVANATISATLESDEYMRIGAAGMELSLSITGASSGWYYRVKNSDTEGYQTPDTTTYTTTSWTMTSTIGAATNHYVVELYNGSNVKMATSNTITVYGETGHPVTIEAGANGSVSPSGVVYANGLHLNPTITATPSSGYRFVNWTLSNGNATLADATSASTTITSASGACTVTANFTACSTVTYMYNGATSGASPASETAASVTLPTPTRTGYVLDGWYTTAGTKVGDGGDSYNVVADITLYARWEESCAAGGTEVLSSVAVNSSYTVVALVGANVASSGLDGSDRTQVGSSSEYANKLGSSGYVRLYPKSGSAFAAGDILYYKVYNGKSSEKSMNVAVFKNDETKYQSSATSIASYETHVFEITLTSDMINATNGYVQVMRGSSNGDGAWFVSARIETTSGGGGTCYHVYYHGNGAESGFVSDTTSYANSASATILDYNDSRYPLTKAGYIFQGWATSADGAVAKTAGQTVTISSADVHYYAVWAVAAPTYDITNGNPSHGTIAITDGSSAITSAEENATVHISATPADGYSFTSWSVTKDAGGSVDVATSSSTNPTTFTMPAEAVTVTATFSPNTYTVTYNLNGASWASSAGVASYTVGTGATLPVAGDMTNIGYTFGGWYANSGLTGSAVTEITTSDYGNKTFWAKWTENTYTITYDKNGGTGSMETTVGRYVTISDNEFTYAGHIFIGWNTLSTGNGTSYSEGEEVELTADMTLYAIWATDYTISWGDVQIGGAGATVVPNLGGGNYTITATINTWTGDVADIELGDVTEGVTAAITGTASNTVTITFAVGAGVTEDEISLSLNVPAHGNYGAKTSTEDIEINRCEGGTTLFTQNFNDATAVVYAANTSRDYSTSSTLSGLVGSGANLFTSIACNAKDNAGIAINSSTGGNSKDATGIFQAYNNNTGAYWSITRTTDFAGTAPTAVKVNMDIWFNAISGASYAGVNFAVGNGFSEGLKSSSAQDASKVHSGFSIINSTPKFYEYNSTSTNIETGTFNNSKWYSVVWIINNTGSDLTYDNPTGTGTTTLANDKFDIWRKLQSDEASEYTLVASAKSATTASVDLQEIYIGSHAGKKQEFRLDNVRVLALSGEGGKITPTLTWETDLSGGVETETGAADFTHTVTQNTNSLGAITYASSNTSVVTVNATTGKVHVVGPGTATITATIAATGCYDTGTNTYTINVADNCADVAGTIGTEDLGCSGIRMTVTGHTAAAGVTYQWYKDGVSLGSADGAQTASYTTTAAGDYYVIVTNTGADHCSKASTNTITVDAMTAATATKIVDEWYVKNGRRTPDIALVQTKNATGFIVKSGSTPIWNSDGSTTTGFAGCEFYLGDDGIIYLKGLQEDGSEPSGLSAGNETLKFTATACGGNSSELSITIHKQAATARKSIAFMVDGTKAGAVTAVSASHGEESTLFKFLDYTASGGTGEYDLTAQNAYWTIDEKTLRQHYSQFDAIVITDDPSTKTVSKDKDDYKTKGYINAIGCLVDIRPILTMEAYVSALANWNTKGINGDPTSPTPRQYAMKLNCKDHEIFAGLEGMPNVETETIGGIDYWTVTMVDKTKSPYAGLADDEKTTGKESVPALQGFEATDVSGLLLLGEISDGAYYAGVERQEEPAARLMLLGVNYQALPSALTLEGQMVIGNAIDYLLKTNMEDVNDCSNYFTGAIDNDWNKAGNWTGGSSPNSPYVKARILKPCVISGATAHLAHLDIVTSGTSKWVGTCSGKLTIEPTAALIIGGEVRAAVAPKFNKGDLTPTTVNDLVLNTSSTAQAALVFNNDKGDTKATVNLYSLGRKISDSNQFQYMAVPMNYVDVNPAFAGEGIYTYVWHEGSGWERRGYYTELYAFEGVGITTNATTASNYTMKGALASTKAQAIPITAENKKLNLIGNSWTAPIQISELEASDFGDATVESTVYIYSTGHDAPEGPQSGSTETAGQWLAIPFNAVGFGAWEGLKVIPSMQAFQIKASSAGTLTLDYSKHVRGGSTDLNAQLRAPQRKAENEDVQLMRIRVADSKTHTDLYLFEGEQFTDAFDDGWEANYRVGDNQSAKLYARTSIGVMAVAAMPSLESTPVYFIPGQETEYTFTFGGSGMGYYLNDLKLEKSTLISEGAEYTFTYERGDAAARFMISATPYGAPEIITGNEEIRSENKARKILYNNKLYIIVNGHVYSAEGALVK